MSRRARTAWAVALLAPLLASGAWLALHGREEGPRPAPGETRGAERAGLAARIHAAAVRRARRERRRAARAEHPVDERAPLQAISEGYPKAQVEAETAARRFHGAFARYELGADVRVALRATATRRFVAQLLSAPPRPLRGRESPAPARLGELELGSLGVDSDPAALELVGRVHRGGRSYPIAFELRRRGGRWRVAALGL